jgi:hypothetical protein
MDGLVQITVYVSLGGNMYEATENVQAYLYLDDNGTEVSRAEFLKWEQYIPFSQKAYMFYVGSYPCYKVAVWGWHESTAWGCAEEWLEHNRPEELNMTEDFRTAFTKAVQEKTPLPEDPSYELYIEVIPVENIMLHHLVDKTGLKWIYKSVIDLANNTIERER